MLVVDPDEDGDNDIVWCSAHGFGVYWLENSTTKDGNRVWHRHAIDTSWSQCHAPLWADLDGDGREELIAGKRYMAHGGSDPGAYDALVAYRYQFNLKTKTWDRWTVTSGDRVGFGLDPKVGDLDNDGDLDLLACGRSGLYWLENQGPGTTSMKILASSPKDLSDFKSSEQWGRRRSQIIQSITKAHGGLPTCSERVRLEIEHGVKGDPALIRYQIEARRDATAKLLIPKSAKPGTASGVVCMFDPSSAELAKETTERLVSLGYVCIVPNIGASGARDPITDGVWQAMRAADVLQATEEVHGERIGFIGNAKSGKLGLFVAAMDQRFVAISTTLDDSSSSSEIPNAEYSFAELIASAAPRALQLTVTGNKNWIRDGKKASSIYALRKAKGRLEIMSTEFDNANAIGWLQRHVPIEKN